MIHIRVDAVEFQIVIRHQSQQVDGWANAFGKPFCVIARLKDDGLAVMNGAHDGVGFLGEDGEGRLALAGLRVLPLVKAVSRNDAAVMDERIFPEVGRCNALGAALKSRRSEILNLQRMLSISRSPCGLRHTTGCMEPEAMSSSA